MTPMQHLQICWIIEAISEDNAMLETLSQIDPDVVGALRRAREHHKAMTTEPVDRHYQPLETFDDSGFQP